MEDPILQYEVLNAVGKSDDKVTQSEIARSIGRSVQSVNFALRLLVVKGCIKIAGTNRLNLRYNLTPKGLMQKTHLAYDFLKRQSGLYEEVRTHLIEKLKNLAADGVRSTSVYGWTPFTETVILYLMVEGIQVNAIYVQKSGPITQWHKIPFRLIGEFQDDCDALILMEQLPEELRARIPATILDCYPVSEGGAPEKPENTD